MSLEEITAVVEHLKAEADRHWRIDPNVSLRCADDIIRIGESVQDTGIIALGTMARGDALRCLHQITDAWDALAGQLPAREPAPGHEGDVRRTNEPRKQASPAIRSCDDPQIVRLQEVPQVAYQYRSED